MSRMKAAILLPNLRGGGAEMLRIRLADVFKSHGIDCEFWLAKTEGELLPLAMENHHIVDLKSPRIRYLYRNLRSTWTYRKPDALLADMWPTTAIAAVCKWRNKSSLKDSRLVLCDHNTLSLKPETQGWLRQNILARSVRYTYPCADARIVVSEGVARDLVDKSGLPRESFQVIYNPGFCEAKGERQNDPWPAARRKFLCVGSMKEQKGFDLAIKAFSSLNDPDSILAIVGEGPLREQLTSLAESLGVADRVIMPGFSSDVRPWYAHADVFCLTSKWEGFGIVIIEAMQYGLQVVSTDCRSGPREILADGKYGQLVPVGDVDAYAQAMRTAMNALIPASSIRRRAADFDMPTIAEKYMQVLFPAHSHSTA